MLIPSIDIMNGNAVQLVGGREKKIDAGDPRPLCRQFGLVGEVAVVDLDQALSKGSNAALIEGLISLAPIRLGGGIRDLETARRWLNAGVEKIVLGTKAVPEILSELPRERVIAALDAVDGEVVVEGWRRRTGRDILSRILELRDYVGGFLVTFVEREGRLGGTKMEAVSEIVSAAGGARVTIAGGVTEAEEIAELDRLGADAQVGMALYSGKLSLAEAFAAPLQSDRADGLWPTVVCDESGRALGLAWSNRESVAEALRLGRGVYHSRRRGLWIKGETSGDRQDLIRIEADCDRDALRFVVRQSGKGFCHLGRFSCFGGRSGLAALEHTICGRLIEAPPGSYTRRLLDEPELLSAKLREEAGELADAPGRDEAVAETADVLYFALVALAKAGGTLAEVERELDRRALLVTRRPGNAKPQSSGKGDRS